MVETMFETYGFGGLKVELQAMLTLYAQGACHSPLSPAPCVVDQLGDMQAYIIFIFLLPLLRHSPTSSQA